MSKIIISGGPGSGKTTLLNALKTEGFRCSEEVSRQMIREQVALKTDCLPWLNLPAFAERVLTEMVDEYKRNSFLNHVTFFDRGIPDIIAYLAVGKMPVDTKFYNAARNYRYNDLVLMAPPWKEIYINDTERWQTFEEACNLYNGLKEIYLELGYHLIELPFASVSNRVIFVLDMLD